MSSIPEKDRLSLCRFSFSDHRRCRSPRSPHHPHFCFYHSRQESHSRATAELAADFAYFFSGNYTSANDLNSALARLFPGIIRGDIKPRMAKTLVYLAQVLSQTIPQAQQEYVNAFGADFWRKTIRTSITQNSKRDQISSQSQQNAPSAPDSSPEIVPPNPAVPPNLVHPAPVAPPIPAAAPPNLVQPVPPAPIAPPNSCHPERSEGSAFPSATPEPSRNSKPHSGPSTQRPSPASRRPNTSPASTPNSLPAPPPSNGSQPAFPITTHKH